MNERAPPTPDAPAAFRSDSAGDASGDGRSGGIDR